MVSKEEQKRRKTLAQAWQEQERTQKKAEAEKRLPISTQGLLDLFRYVDGGWEEHGCDHTPRRTVKYLDSIGLPEDKQNIVLEWFKEQGGACDCEILANVVEHWVEGYDPEEWSYQGI